MPRRLPAMAQRILAPLILRLRNSSLAINSLLAIIDQVLLSALNFMIGILLIRFATKETYGLYAQLFAAGLFANTLLDAWIDGPLTTVIGRFSAAERAQILQKTARRQLRSACVLAVLAGMGAWGALSAAGWETNESSVLPNFPWSIAGAFALYVLANGMREYQRTALFIEHAVASVLRMDAIYAGLVLTGMGVLIYLDWHDIVSVLILVSTAALVTQQSMQHHFQSVTHNALSGTELVALNDEMNRHGWWAVPGVVVGWAANYSYLFLTGLWIGVLATADLNATRLLLIPIALTTLAWSRVAKPRASQYFAEADWQSLRRLTWMSLLAIEVITLSYVIALYFAYPLLQKYVLGAKYGGLEPLVIFWGIYFSLNTVRWVATTWLASAGAYKTLFWQGCSSLVVLALVAQWAIPELGVRGAIITLIVVELTELMVNWFFLLPRLQARMQREAQHKAITQHPDSAT